MIPNKHPRVLRLLGFDFGEKRIGVATGQMITGTAEPLKVITSRDRKPDWTAIEALIREWNPDALVVGIPLHLDGSRQPMTAAAEKFGRQLEGRFGLVVYQADERLSSDGAITNGNNTEIIDALAAQIILESWMNNQTERS